MKGPIEYIKESWRIYTDKTNFLFFAKVMAVLTIVDVSFRYLYNYLYPTNYLENTINSSDITSISIFILLTIISLIITFWFYSTETVAVIKLSSDPKTVFSLGFKKIGKYFLTSVVIGLIVLGGLILFVIPAIIFGVWYSFTIFLIFDKDLKLGEALKQSKALVKGKFWAILGRSLVFGLFGFVLGFVFGLIPYVGSMIILFIGPFLILPSYLLYKDLVAGSSI